MTARGVMMSISSLALLAVGAAGAQSPGAEPTFGEIALSTEFSPDPHRVSLQAGGPISAAALGPACAGFIAEPPDFRLEFRAGERLPLVIYAEADADTTLVVRGPDQSWRCDDNSRGDFNPQIVFDDPVSGRYDIWVGVYEAGAIEPATLAISELADD